MSTFQVAYKVLETDLLRATDRERAANIAMLIASDDDARLLSGKEGFGYKLIDGVNGRAGVVTYRGAEIVLLFKRKVTQLEVGAADPIPQCEIKDPAEVWIRINLLDPKVPYFARTELAKAQDENKRLRLLLKSANVDLGETKATAATARVQRDELSKLNTIIDNLRNAQKASDKDVEMLNKKLAEKSREEAARLGNLATEVLPSYDTVRMALEVDPANKMMSGLQGQLRSMLRSFGCEVISPEAWTLFDPEFHHAVHGYPFASGDPRIGKVVKVSTVGLKRGGVVLKAANVAVGIEKKD